MQGFRQNVQDFKIIVEDSAIFVLVLTTRSLLLILSIVAKATFLKTQTLRVNVV